MGCRDGEMPPRYAPPSSLPDGNPVSHFLHSTAPAAEARYARRFPMPHDGCRCNDWPWGDVSEARCHSCGVGLIPLNVDGLRGRLKTTITSVVDLAFMTCTSFQGCPWRSNEHNTGTEEWGKALNSWQGAAVVPAKERSRREILPAEGLLPRGPPTLNAAAEAHKALAYPPKSARRRASGPYQALRRHSCGTSAAP